MRNNFKHIIAAIAFSSAVLFPGALTQAQNIPEGAYILALDEDTKEPNGIAFRKSAVQKDANTYTVNLETFVTGEVKVSNVTYPADIVLVLDVSGSMDEPMTYEARPSQSYSYRSYGDNTYYFLYEGNYYKVIRDISRRYGYCLRIDGLDIYLNTGYVNREDNTIWTGVLYEVKETKMDALKKAVNGFIETIHLNDIYETDKDGKLIKDEDGNYIKRKKDGVETPLGNQISIVKFGYATYNGSTTNASTTPGNHYYHIYSDWGGIHYEYTLNYQPPTNSSVYYNCSEVRVGFTPTATEANVSELQAAVNDFVASGATAADYGMNLANLLLKDLQDKENSKPEAERRKSNKTVVFFTDGSPTHESNFNDDVAIETIKQSNISKNTYKANVFSIGVFSNMDDATKQKVDRYMDRVSSNYKNATNLYDGTKESGANFYFDASDPSYDLSEIFKAVAESSGGSGSTIGEGTIVTVDVVANSFSLPEGTDASSITVKVAPCTGITDVTDATKLPDEITGKSRPDKYLTFGTAKPAKGTDYTGNEGYPIPIITPKVGKDGELDMVTTEGFDFSKNWCGYNAQTGKYQGYKQIISFDVKVNDDAVGGPAVATNDGKSGIYVTDESGIKKNVATFNRPTVRLPISIWIAKFGLEEEDSAVFTLRYAKYDKNKDPREMEKSEWQSFTKVIVNVNDPVYTSDEYSGIGHIVKITGLDPDFFYRIDEDAWAWTYEHETGTHYVGYSQDQKNPFHFVNTEKGHIKEHEATVRNVFGANPKVIDPKEKAEEK